MDYLKDSKSIAFLVLFAAAGLLAMHANFSQLLGAPNQFFTGFQFFAPVAGAFLGGMVGAGVVIAAQVADMLLTGKAFTLLNLARLLPLAFAAWYFSTPRKSKLTAVVPLAAIALFLLHPVGGQVWYYPLMFWGIPVVVALFFANNLFARSLGATMTAHAVGGVVWIYSLPTTPAFWAGLVPVVAYERLLFAAGIAVSYVAFNAVLSRLKAPGFVRVDRRLPLATPSA